MVTLFYCTDIKTQNHVPGAYLHYLIEVFKCLITVHMPLLA